MTERRKREPKLTAQLVIMELPEIAGRLRAWAEVRDIEIAEICREVGRAGLAALEPRWVKENDGELDPEFLAAHTANSIKRKGTAGNTSAA